MMRRVHRVPYRLDAEGVAPLPLEEIQAILRGADDLIMRGGRNLLMKVLKGSRAKDVLAKSLDESPVHGYFKHLSSDEILKRIDWVILNGYLAIEHDYRLPLLVFTYRGWPIAREVYADELLRKMDEALARRALFDVNQLKDRN